MIPMLIVYIDNMPERLFLLAMMTFFFTFYFVSEIIISYIRGGK